ncbi:MAG: paraquat-inducible protein A [Gammaproteobacteria bacterium]
MTLLSHLSYPFAAALAALVVIDSMEAERLAQAAAEMQSLAGSTRMAWAGLLERLSLSWYTGARDLAEAYAGVVTAADTASRRALTAAAGLGALGVLQLIAVAWFTRGRRAALAWHLNLVAACAFVVGVLAPMMTVVAHAEMPLLGEVILSYEAKSLVSTTSALAGGGNLLLATLIAAFSMLLPLLKMALVATAVGPVSDDLHRRCIVLLHAVGKWSMADVFVVAVLVAFLAGDKDAYSSAFLGPGLYAFAAYCLLSMLAGQLAQGTRP